MLYLFLIIIGGCFVLTTILNFFLNLEYFVISFIIGMIILFIGVLSSTENHMKSYRLGNSFTHELQQEIRREKEEKGDFDYTDRQASYGIGFILKVSGLIVIV